MILEVHEQYIHCLVEDPGVKISLYVNCVYARNEIQKIETPWKDVMQIILQQQLPWVLCGDFNSVLG